ncbi:hypothetical protein GDO78_015187 [Eleutherodactylus coqui]|uniref:Uncharacterized protein n=1 Tax=Eleutherodactylus coqui TaxID=57060 RepID=A0A8J6BG97_ELECQ|nr:hypothetical protein GDO78_015187 [Eleutherodactylus coqui]
MHVVQRLLAALLQCQCTSPGVPARDSQGPGEDNGLSLSGQLLCL